MIICPTCKFSIHSPDGVCQFCKRDPIRPPRHNTPIYIEIPEDNPALRFLQDSLAGEGWNPYTGEYSPGDVFLTEATLPVGIDLRYYPYVPRRSTCAQVDIRLVVPDVGDGVGTALANKLRETYDTWVISTIPPHESTVAYKGYAHAISYLDDRWKLYSICDIAILPFEYEYEELEALACGAIIVYDEGYEEVLSSIASLLENRCDWMKMREQGRKEAERRSWQQLVTTLDIS